MQLHTLSSFIEYCAGLGIGMSKPTYRKYEKLGVFFPGKYSLSHKKRTDRLFTDGEMIANVQHYKMYKIHALQGK